jgi:hypothetical protein
MQALEEFTSRSPRQTFSTLAISFIAKQHAPLVIQNSINARNGSSRVNAMDYQVFDSDFRRLPMYSWE